MINTDMGHGYVTQDPCRYSP